MLFHTYPPVEKLYDKRLRGQEHIIAHEAGVTVEQLEKVLDVAYAYRVID